jgi:predicted DNA-binding protein with PD1-like motif
MRYLKLGDAFMVRLETGEEIHASLKEFATRERIDVAGIEGIGSVYDAVLGYFDRGTREYLRRTVPEEMEILSLAGNLAIKESQPFAHLHAVLGGRNYEAVAGHLFEGRTGATCEMIVRPLKGFVQRTLDPVTGLYLLDL